MFSGSPHNSGQLQLQSLNSQTLTDLQGLSLHTGYSTPAVLYLPTGSVLAHRVLLPTCCTAPTYRVCPGTQGTTPHLLYCTYQQGLSWHTGYSPPAVLYLPTGSVLAHRVLLDAHSADHVCAQVQLAPADVDVAHSAHETLKHRKSGSHTEQSQDDW